MSTRRRKEGDWRPDALCKTLADAGLIEHDLFFPVGSKGPAAEQIEEAKRICFDCPVRRPCLAEAESKPGTAGVWGGTSEDDRLAARRRARALSRA